MLDLSIYYRNPFSGNNIPDAELKKFTEDHLSMMTENNESGQFTTIIAETVAAYNAYFGPSADKDTTDGVQSQLNQSMRITFEEFITQVTAKEPEIRTVWGLESPQYKEFYPSGITEYNNASIVDVESLMTRYINASSNHIHELGQGFVDIFNGLRTNYISAREAQLRNISDTNVSEANTPGRALLEKQLMKNILTFAIVYMDFPEKGMAFFNTDITTNPAVGEEVRPIPEPAVEQKGPVK